MKPWRKREGEKARERGQKTNADESIRGVAHMSAEPGSCLNNARINKLHYQQTADDDSSNINIYKGNVISSRGRQHIWPPPHPHLYLPGGGDPSMSDVAAVVELANINREGSWVPGGKLT